MKLNKEQREQIAGALLGGQYRKARGVLKRAGGHCCLGVICAEVGVMRGVYAEIRDAEGHLVDRDGLYLPSAIAEAVGLTRAQQKALAQINDTKPGFREQARLILDDDVPSRTGLPF